MKLVQFWNTNHN